MKLWTMLAACMAMGSAASAAEYRAEPVYAAVKDQIVLRDIVWRRSGVALEAPKSNSRPAIVCALLAREVGKLSSFAVAGTPIAPAELEKCNARAPR